MAKRKRKRESQKADDWINAQTLLGTSSDKTSQTSYETRGRLSGELLETLYNENALASRIVDRLPDDGTREPFEIKDPDVEFDKDALDSILEDLNVMTHLGDAWRWARLFGGSLFVMAVNDGKKLEDPLEIENIRGIAGFSVIDRRWATPRLFDPGLGSRSFANPRTYDLFVPWGRMGMREIHRSRVIRFDSFRVNPYTLIKGDGWAPSVLQRVYSTLKRLGTNRKSTENILLHISIFLYRMQGFRKAIEGSKAARAAMEDYFATIRGSMDTLHMMVFDKEDEFDEKQIGNLTGLVQMLERSLEDLVSETDMPKVILLGETPGGLNTGENAGEVRAWYDHVRAQQEKILTKPINRILDVIFAMWKRAGKAVPTKWTIDYAPLWQLTESEKADNRKKNAETDNTYWEMGTLEAGEIRQARFIDGETGDIKLSEEQAQSTPEPKEPETEIETEPEEIESDESRIVREIPEGETLLRASEIAERLQISASTVLKMAKSGQIRCFQLPNGRYRFSWKEVASAVSEQTIANT